MDNYLKEKQPVIFKTLLNYKSSNGFPHALLLNGNKDTPLIEAAKYIAKFIVCDSSSPCQECLDCLRIDSNNYTDLIIIDGSNQMIKKEDIEMIQDRFFLSSIEKKGIKVYIINKIENSTTIALNALLKFLEEPSDDVYAIITTSNNTNVLPTIISRCINIRFKPVSSLELVVSATKKNIPLEDALIISKFSGSIESIVDIYEKGSYITIKDVLIELLNQIIEDEDILYFSQLEISDIIKDKNDFCLLLELLEICFLDIINYASDSESSFCEHQDLIGDLYKKVKNAESKLETIMLFKGKAMLNANIKLLLDSLMINLMKED